MQTSAMNMRKLLILVVCVCILWTYMMHRYLNKPPYINYLKNDILRRSYEFVYRMASEQQEIEDSPYNGYETAYDMKKTLAVLLQDMNERLSKLEKGYENLTPTNASHILRLTSVGGDASAQKHQQVSNRQLQSGSVSERKADPVVVNFKSLLLGKQETCELTEESKMNFPQCDTKVEWMTAHWKSDPCYAKLGVDGSVCSIIIYLSELEEFCPRLAFRNHLITGNTTQQKDILAQVNSNLDGLNKLLTNPSPTRDSYGFIKTRVAGMWPAWVEAAKQHQQQILHQRKKLKILFYLGFLSKDGHLNIVENSKTGGPLGEYVQWSDIIASHYVLGHKMILMSEVPQLVQFVKDIPQVSGGCQVKSSLIVDLIYTDIVGLIQIKQKFGNLYPQFSCLFRIVDTFGTQPKFNFGPYALAHKLKSPWGMKMLWPKQFFTMFPHTPDNSFMGFVISQPETTIKEKTIVRGKPIALVYGKASYMWKSAAKYLDILQEFFEVHATVGDTKDSPSKSFIPSFVVNHGLLAPKEYFKLLEQATVFVGLGFPYEGPAPLEAIARGAIFLNPRFNPPHHRLNNKFFLDKPTDRQLQSQHPYVAMRYAEPYSYQIDTTNATSVRAILMHILSQPDTSRTANSYIPYEMTHAGMLQRVSAYLEHLKFCGPPAHSLVTALPSYRDKNLWPPLAAGRFLLGKQGNSCTETCQSQNFVCEPNLFGWVNHLEELEERGLHCPSVLYRIDVVAPAVIAQNADSPAAAAAASPTNHNQTCVFLSEPMLFSCSEAKDNYMRLCPCRTVLPNQWALCPECL